MTVCKLICRSCCVLLLVQACLNAEHTVWYDSSEATPSCDLEVCDSGLFAATEYLNWRPTTRGSDFAISESGVATTLGTGLVHHVDLDRDSGFRGRIGYRTATGWSLSFQYTYFDANGASSITRPPGIGQLFATQSHPDGNEEANTADASSTFDYKVFDLIAERTVIRSAYSETRLFGGIRWADIDQELETRYDGRDFIQALVAKSSTTTGAGIRMGTSTDWILAGGFRLHGQVSGGLLFSEIGTQYYETNFGGTVTLVDVFDGRDGSVPFIQTSIGLEWNHRLASVMVGYELENWFGLHDRSMFVDDIHEATYATVSEDVLLSGLFVRLSADF